MPRLTIIVRAHNDESVIGDTLNALLSQTIPPGELQILCIDDHSTDHTGDIIDSFQQVTHVKAEGTYQPGRILNFAVALASANIIVCNNSDAVPDAPDYLEKLIAPLSDPRVGAVFGNQLPRLDALPLVRKDYERAFGDGSISSRWDHFFSMASSASTRSIMRRYPFREDLHYSEDVEWASRLKEAGFAVRYAPNAPVRHSHNYTLRQLWTRFHGEGVADAKIFHAKPSIPNFLRRLAGESARDVVYLIRHGHLLALFTCFPRRAVQFYAYHRGLCHAREGSGL